MIDSKLLSDVYLKMSAIKGISIGVLVTLIIILVVYIVLMFEWYKNRTVVFAPYTPPAPPADQNAFYPISNVQPMSQEDICRRNINIYCSNFNTYGATGAPEPAKYAPGVPNLTQCAALLNTPPPANVSDLCDVNFTPINPSPPPQ
jgi:hypothetical protein